MEIVALSGIAILAAILAVMLKKYNPEYSILISLGAGALLLWMIPVSYTHLDVYKRQS